MIFKELNIGDKFDFVPAAMFNQGGWFVVVPARNQTTGLAMQGHHELAVRADREVRLLEKAPVE